MNPARKSLCILVSTFFVAANACAQAPAVEAQCAALENLAYPATDFPNAAQARALKGCSPSDLYYGIHQKQDVVRARHCALMPDTEDDVYSEKKGVLMMLYANGQGVRRNLRLAKKAACEAAGAEAEVEGRLRHLAELEKSGKAAERIDFCDDITSGMMMGYCTSISSAQAGVRRDAALAALIAHWSAAERAAFARLRKQADAFAQARSGNEVDMTGTAHVAMAFAEEDKQKDAFLAALKACEAGKPPRFSEAQYQALDRELNTVYRKIRAMPDPDFGTIDKAGIQAAQRAWLGYRDAWVEFGKLRYPAVPAHAWRALLTQQRNAMLNELLDELSQ